jgi:hypothetical protein
MAKISFYTSIVAIMCCLSQVSNAQITLEHTFKNENVSVMSGNVNGKPNFFVEKLFPVGSFYLTEVVNNSVHIKAYNPDYTLIIDKTYSLTPPTGYKVSHVWVFKKVFNTDDNYELLVTFSKISPVSNDNEACRLILYDSNRNVIKDFGAGHMFYIGNLVYIINNSCKVRIVRRLYSGGENFVDNTEIYSVPGDPSAYDAGNTSVDSFSSPYPNPANTYITLPYKLNEGEFAVMNIFNINGQLIESKKIGYDFDKILLDVSGYAKGMYIYEVKNVSNKFVVK